MSTQDQQARSYRQGRASATSGVGMFAGIPKPERVALYDRSIVLSRIFAHDAASWVLKGGTALIWRDPAARSTRDLDLYSAAPGITEAVTALRAALSSTSVPPADISLVVRDDEIDIHTEGRRDNAAIRVHLLSAAGVEVSQPVKIDLVVGCRITGSIESEPNDGISKALKAEFPEIRLYPIADHLADKVAATMQSYPGPDGGKASTRVHDLIDIAHIALTETIDGHELCVAVESERRERGLAEYADGFQCPETWVKLYPKGARKRGGAPNRFDDALEIAKKLIDPAITGAASGLTWSNGQWSGEGK